MKSGPHIEPKRRHVTWASPHTAETWATAHALARHIVDTELVPVTIVIEVETGRLINIHFPTGMWDMAGIIVALAYASSDPFDGKSWALR